LLKELDQMKNDLGALDVAVADTWQACAESDRSAGPVSMDEVTDSSCETMSGSEPEALSSQNKASLRSEVPAAGEKTDHVNETVVEEASRGPGKLPEHLRPKLPADSQDAAKKALEDLFGR
jgi:hypothetical protein